jgi:SAM-dependent methyltransferase
MIDALERYGPSQPVPVLVAELNKLYHEHEASGYDSTHPEIFEQLPPIWREMIAQFELLHQDAKIGGDSEGGKSRILDFGCGTGFEAQQCLAGFGAGRVERIVCYDPSTRMLDRCRRALEPWTNWAEFITDLRELAGIGGEFNVLLTNSVLHHMVDPVRAIREIMPLLSADAVWLCGHEPSPRFLRNPECRAVLGRHRSFDRWRQFLSPRSYGRRLLRWAGVSELPQDYAARRAFEQSMFERRPPARLVSRLVDFHVVASEQELAEAKGLDFRELQLAFAGEWELVWRRTYAFLGPYYERKLSPHWAGEARRLAEQYPDDGANCCLVWRRSGVSRNSR